MTVAQAEFDDVPLERVEAEIMQWSGDLAAATARLMAMIGAYDRREGWKSWGCRSTAQWLSWKCGESLHTAREKVRVARAVEDLPVINAAFRAGRLSYSKVRAITRVAAAADEHEWLEIAQTSTGAQLDRIVGAVRSALDRDENGDAKRAFDRRRTTRKTREDGLGEIRIVGPRDAIDTIWAAVEAHAGRMIDDAANEGTASRRELIDGRGGLGAIRFDALQQIAEAAIAQVPLDPERGDIGRLQLVIDTDFIEAVAAEAGSGAGECTLSGSRVAPEVALRWACDIRSSVVLEQGGHARDEGRTRRTPNRRLRRALHRRDGGMCRFPGCGATAWLHAHHIVHWARGGPTALDNLVSLCSFHHHLVHEGDWSVALVDGAVVWSDPEGVPATVEPLRGDQSAITAMDVPAGTIESRWHNDRLDFNYVVAVLADHCVGVRQRPRGDVPAGTPVDPDSEQDAA